MAHKLYLAGERIDTKNYLDVHYPFDQSVVGSVSLASPEHVEKAIQTALESLEETRKLEPYQRANALKYIVQELKERHEEFSELLVKENGKTIKEARGEMTRCINTFEIAVGEAERLEGDYIPAGVTQAAAGRHIILKKFPIGVVAGITPFNFPINLMAHKVAPAIASGCPIVVKPASATPLSTLKFAEIVEKSGWPKGAFSVLPCDRKTGQQLVEDERIKLLSFTGSPHVGWKMKEQAGKKKVVLELGGDAALVVDKHIDDRDRVIERTKIGAFYQAGQSCISVQRIFVHEDVVDTFQDKFLTAVSKMKVGDPMDEKIDIGGVIDKKNTIRLKSRIDNAIDAGATCLIGNDVDGTLLKPTVLVDVPSHVELSNEEAFGPVVMIDTFNDYDALVEKINSSAFGLQIGVFSNNINNIWKLFENVEVGGVIQNDVPSRRVDHMPYGGVKDSGFGREGLRYAIEDMLEPRILVLKPEV